MIGSSVPWVSFTKSTGGKDITASKTKGGEDIPIDRRFIENVRGGKSFRSAGELITPSRASKMLKPYFTSADIKRIKTGDIGKIIGGGKPGDKYTMLAAKGGLVTSTKLKPKKTKYACGLFK
tara:strand:- start:495 stop:860 length:366 start_codon:yes stop_codon:yes gene_type:complete